MIVLVLALALILSGVQQGDETPEEQLRTQRASNSAYEAHRHAAIQMNDLAGHIRSETDAHELTDAIVKMFADSLPPAWTTQSLLHRVAHAEYEAVTDSSQLIPEQRIADVWNEYVRQIGAPDEALVNAAEIHNMRDASYASGQYLWKRGSQTVWTMSNIYALGANGKVADGCRALEALRVLYQLENLFENVRGARERLQKGIVASDVLSKADTTSRSGSRATGWLQVRADGNPVRPAEQRYIRERGAENFAQLLERLFNQLFPA
jgi:hypothetical protein